MAKIETRTPGQLAVGSALCDLVRVDTDDGVLHVLNSGKAYNGEMILGGKVTIRDRAVPGEIPMLAQHSHSAVLGAWTGVRVDGSQVLASGMRWADPNVIPESGRYQHYMDERLVWGVSIGFRGRWMWRGDLPKDHAAYSEDGGWFIEDPEVYEASLVTVAADSDSMITYAMGAVPRGGVLEIEQEDQDAIVSGYAQLMAAHLQEHHDMSPEDAEAQVRAMLDGERVEDDGEPAEDAESEDDKAADAGGSTLSDTRDEPVNAEEPESLDAWWSAPEPTSPIDQWWAGADSP